MKLPGKLWGEAVHHAVYILNRLPTRALSNQTPYEAWTGLKPNMSHIRVFGCITHMKNLKICMNKLGDQSKQVINLGREPGTKAYRLYDLVGEKLMVSRDVVFDETATWSWFQHEETEAQELNTFPVLDELETKVRGQQESDTKDSGDTGELKV